jgi:hypothetical protein
MTKKQNKNTDIEEISEKIAEYFFNLLKDKKLYGTSNEQKD